MAGLFIDVLRGYVREGKFRVREFVVMPNHVHLLVTVSREMTIEKAMQLIKGGFSFRAKKELGFLGEIWQRDFRTCRSRMKELGRASFVHSQQPRQSGIGECSGGVHA